jgi:competence protein ComEC
MRLQFFLNKTNQALSKVFLSITARFAADRTGLAMLDADAFSLLIAGIMAAGAALYFYWPVEPDIIGMACWAAAIVLAAIILIRQSVFYRHGFCLLAFLLGFAIAWIHVVAAQSTIILAQNYDFVQVEGRVESATVGEKGVLLVMHPVSANQKNQKIALQKLSLWIKKGKNNTDYKEIKPGDDIRVNASLKPPQPPLYPGDSDRRLVDHLAGNSASGFVMGPVEFLNQQESASWDLWIANIRHKIDDRLMDVLPGSSGAVAAALLTGNQSAIPAEKMQAIRNSGLAHLLSISGLHMTLVAGFFFLIVRRLGVLGQKFLPGLRSWPIKKIAGVVALLAGAGYLAISGASIPAQRSFVALALLMIAIVIDRDALNLRMVAVGLMLVVATAPEQIRNPGTLMSFLAVISLIASFQAFSKAGGRQFWRDRGWPDWIIALLAWPFGMIATSLIAGFATWPIALAYFHSSANYAVLSNMVAVPLASFFVMPLGIIGLLLMPFGIDRPFLSAMNWGIEKLLWISDYIATLPGSVSYQGVMPDLFLVGVVLLIFLLSLGRGVIKAVLLVVGLLIVSLLMVGSPPDILLSHQDQAMALRQPAGMVMIGGKTTSYRAKRWQRAMVSPIIQTIRQAQDQKWLGCDDVGCVIAIQGQKIAIPKNAETLVDDCYHADFVLIFDQSNVTCPEKNLVFRAQQSSAWHPDDVTAIYFRPNDKLVFGHTPVPTRPWNRISSGGLSQQDGLEP